VDAKTFRAWILGAAKLVTDNAEHLTHLDAAIGDGDHGLNMRRGFDAAVLMIEATDPATPGAVLDTVGRALISKVGGASGPLYGTGFRSAGKSLGTDPVVSAEQLGAALQAALAGIQQLGGASEGDKTIVDALAPAVSAYHAVVSGGGGIAEATRAAADACSRGLAATVPLAARKGRASYLGSRSMGHEDPGAASMTLILDALAAAAVNCEDVMNSGPSASTHPTSGREWTGSGLAPGSAVAASFRVDRPLSTVDVAVAPQQVEAAFRKVATEFDQLAARVRAQGRSAAADIVAVGALIATDPDLLAAAVDAATCADNPLRGIRDAVESYAGMLAALPDPTLRERAADVRQVGRRVIETLVAGDSAVRGTGRFILVAAEIGPVDLLEGVGNGLVGAVTAGGGANSHAAIVARSIGLPLVGGVDPAVLDLPDGTLLLVDADAGVVMADPAESDVARVTAAEARQEDRRMLLAADRGLPHVCADGTPFVLLCNVASDIEVHRGRDSGAEGIGLLRTELPFLDADRWPGGADHRRTLRPIMAGAAGWPVTVRLLDFANDKIPPFLPAGQAGLQALLDHPEALAAQIRAVVDLARGSDLKIMVPMVTAVEDLVAVCAVVDAVVAELGVAPVPVGAMIETVEAVEAVRDLCQIADFLSLGTNDLTSQALSLDRRDPRARPALTAHPLVLAMVGKVVAAAAAAGRPLSVCGDAGSHPTTLPLLVGAGVRTFSVACARIDETRYRLRRLDPRDCRPLYAEALDQASAEKAAALVRAAINVDLP
jgi:dihydroxyacetone kinase phosphoprotein-dependent L subunit